MLDLYTEFVYLKLSKKNGYLYNDTPDEKIRTHENKTSFCAFYDFSSLNLKTEEEILEAFKDFSSNDFRGIFKASEVKKKNEERREYENVKRNTFTYSLDVFGFFEVLLVCDVVILKDFTGFFRYSVEIQEIPAVPCNDIYLVYPDLCKGHLLTDSKKYIKILGRDGNKILGVKIKTYEGKPEEFNYFPKFFVGLIKDRETVEINEKEYKLYGN